jgi:hypothetical protein
MISSGKIVYKAALRVICKSRRCSENLHWQETKKGYQQFTISKIVQVPNTKLIPILLISGRLFSQSDFTDVQTFIDSNITRELLEYSF